MKGNQASKDRTPGSSTGRPDDRTRNQAGGSSKAGSGSGARNSSAGESSSGPSRQTTGATDEDGQL